MNQRRAPESTRLGGPGGHTGPRKDDDMTPAKPTPAEARRNEAIARAAQYASAAVKVADLVHNYEDPQLIAALQATAKDFEAKAARWRREAGARG